MKEHEHDKHEEHDEDDEQEEHDAEDPLAGGRLPPPSFNIHCIIITSASVG